MTDGETACISVFLSTVCSILTRRFLPLSLKCVSRYSRQLKQTRLRYVSVCRRRHLHVCVNAYYVASLQTFASVTRSLQHITKGFYFDFSSKQMRYMCLWGNGLMKMTVNTCTCNELP